MCKLALWSRKWCVSGIASNSLRPCKMKDLFSTAHMQVELHSFHETLFLYEFYQNVVGQVTPQWPWSWPVGILELRSSNMPASLGLSLCLGFLREAPHVSGTGGAEFLSIKCGMTLQVWHEYFSRTQRDILFGSGIGKKSYPNQDGSCTRTVWHSSTTTTTTTTTTIPLHFSLKIFFVSTRCSVAITFIIPFVFT